MKSTLARLIIVSLIATASCVAQSPADSWQPVVAALGRHGQTLTGDVYELVMPRRDLYVTKDESSVAARSAPGSLAAFKIVGHGDAAKLATSGRP